MRKGCCGENSAVEQKKIEKQKARELKKAKKDAAREAAQQQM